MVSIKEDKVDFDKLEKELYAAVAAEEKYQRENDAKFRAVNQKVANYDEFRDIVLASNLKPLAKDERVEKVAERYTHTWNACADEKTQDSQSESKPAAKFKAKTLPKNGLELARDWRRLQTAKERYLLMLEISPEQLGQIFKSEMSLLGDILLVLHEQFKDENVKNVISILEVMKEGNRFSLSYQFLSVKEVDACKGLFEKIELLRDAELYNDEKWQTLRNVYSIK